MKIFYENKQAQKYLNTTDRTNSLVVEIYNVSTANSTFIFNF